MRGVKTSTRLAMAARLSSPGNRSGKRSRAIWVILRQSRAREQQRCRV